MGYFIQQTNLQYDIENGEIVIFRATPEQARLLAASHLKPDDPQTAGVKNRLRTILVASFEVKSAYKLGDLQRDLDLLSKQSKKVDPTHIGVDLRMTPSNLEYEGAGKTESDTQEPLQSWQDVPLGDALDYLCNAAHLVYRIKDGKVILFRELP